MQTEAYGKDGQYSAWQLGQAEDKVYLNRQEFRAGNQKNRHGKQLCKNAWQDAQRQTDKEWTLGPHCSSSSTNPG